MPRTIASNLLIRILLVLAGLGGTVAGVLGFLAGLKGTLPDLLGLACIPLSMASIVVFVLGAAGGLWSARATGTAAHPLRSARTHPR